MNFEQFPFCSEHITHMNTHQLAHRHTHQHSRQSLRIAGLIKSHISYAIKSLTMQGRKLRPQKLSYKRSYTTNVIESALYTAQTRRTVNVVSLNYLRWTIRDLLDSFRYFCSASSET